TSGPGATNLITAIASAYMDSIPMVIITGQVNSKLIGRDVFQEADIIGACEPFVKNSYLVKDAQKMPQILKEAFYIAKSGRPGPVLIDIPVDVLNTEVKSVNFNTDVDIMGYKPNSKGHPLQIKRAAEAISSAKKPIICAGGGVILSNSVEKVISLAEKCNIPVVNTLMGVGIMPNNHELHLGLIGKYGVNRANFAISNSDLLIICGARVGDRSFSENNEYSDIKTVIHIDIDPAEIGKNLKADIPIVGDINSVLTDLIEKCDSSDHKDWINECFSIEQSVISTNDNELNPSTFLKQFCGEFKNSIMTCDVGQNQIWSANSFNIENGRFLTSGGMGTMGYSLPCAVGAAMANQGRTVICVCGDGGFQMCFNELATVKKYNLNIKIILLNNNCLGMIKELHKEKGFTQVGVSTDGAPDFCGIASCYGIPSIKVKNNDDIADAISKANNTEGPLFIECIVDGDFPSRC
ncbi:MAG: acetolactate synthase, large subunit, biosynthetic type, partial [Clostridia bacterium]|nr:acetolactate synthase, large subunit, biosynthetic type [Clostridia bacterium]